MTLPSQERKDRAAGWFADYDGVVLRLDPAGGAVRWRTELAHDVSHLSVSHDATRVVASGRGVPHTILATDTGAVVASYPCRGSAPCDSPASTSRAATAPTSSSSSTSRRASRTLAGSIW